LDSLTFRSISIFDLFQVPCLAKAFTPSFGFNFLQFPLPLFSKSAAKLKMNYFIKCFDVYTWILVLTAVVALTSLFQTQSNRRITVVESIFAPLVEISPPNIELKKRFLQFIFVLWMLTCLFLTNFYKIFLTESTVLPMANNPPDKWSEVFDNFYSIYSFMQEGKEKITYVRFEYEQTTLTISRPRSFFEQFLCHTLPYIQYFGDHPGGDLIPFCDAGDTFLPEYWGRTVSLEKTHIQTIHIYNNLKVIAELEPCIGSSGGNHVYKCLIFNQPSEELKLAENFLSDCNGAVLVETEEAFKTFILERLPKRSAKRNLFFKLSSERLHIGMVVLMYKKYRNPTADRVFTRLVEQGFYMYWYNLLLLARKHNYLVNNTRKENEFHAQGLHSNISGVFFIYLILTGACLIYFILEWLYSQRNNILFGLRSFKMILRFSRSIHFADINKDSQKVMFSVKNSDSNVLDFNLKRLKTIKY